MRVTSPSDAEPVEEEWFGWRPMSCDGKPIIDRVPRYANTYVAAGHSIAFRYAVVLHAGDPATAGLARQYQKWASQPLDAIPPREVGGKREAAP